MLYFKDNAIRNFKYTELPACLMSDTQSSKTKADVDYLTSNDSLLD